MEKSQEGVNTYVSLVQHQRTVIGLIIPIKLKELGVPSKYLYI